MLNSTGSSRFAVLAMCGMFSMSVVAAAQPAKPTPEPLPSSVVLSEMPTDSKEVAAAIGSAKPGDRITLRGRIALAKDAFDASKSVFTLTDDAAAAGCCPKDGTLVDSCKLNGEQKATIQLVDASGQPKSGGLDGRNGLKHGAEVFVVGTVASTNGKDALVINATALHVPMVGLPLGVISKDAGPDAKDVSDVKKAGGLKKGDKVMIRGLIGGSKAPFVGGRAMFTLVGNAIKPCNAKPGDKCSSPWDYCCDPKSAITANSATIRVVDAQGNPLKLELKGRAGLRELSDVIVAGTVSMADKATLIVDATSVQVVAP